MGSTDITLEWVRISDVHQSNNLQPEYHFKLKTGHTFTLSVYDSRDIIKELFIAGVELHMTTEAHAKWLASATAEVRELIQSRSKERPSGVWVNV